MNSYKELLIQHGDKIEIDDSVGLYAYLGGSYTRDIKGIATGQYDGDPDLPYELKDAKIYKGLWKLDLDNFNPQVLTDKGKRYKKQGGQLVFTFELEPTLAFVEDDGTIVNFYQMDTNEDYHGVITCDLIITVEEAILDYLGLSAILSQTTDKTAVA